MSKILFIPVYNCNIQVKRLINKIKKKELDQISEILFIDNQSSDQTLETGLKETKKMKKKLQLF